MNSSWETHGPLASGKLTVCDIENGPVEIVDLPINSMVMFQFVMSTFTRPGNRPWTLPSPGPVPSILPKTQRFGTLCDGILGARDDVHDQHGPWSQLVKLKKMLSEKFHFFDFLGPRNPSKIRRPTSWFPWFVAPVWRWAIFFVCTDSLGRHLVAKTAIFTFLVTLKWVCFKIHHNTSTPHFPTFFQVFLGVCPNPNLHLGTTHPVNLRAVPSCWRRTSIMRSSCVLVACSVEFTMAWHHFPSPANSLLVAPMVKSQYLGPGWKYPKREVIKWIPIPKSGEIYHCSIFWGLYSLCRGVGDD